VVDLRDHEAGSSIPSQVRFGVRANTRQVELQVACTDLCRAGDPKSKYRIPVAGAGAEVMCEQAGGMGSGTQRLAWLRGPSQGILPAGWTGVTSEAGVFTASSGEVFDQDVTVDISWQATDLDLPTGQYCGIVKLIGMVRP